MGSLRIVEGIGARGIHLIPGMQAVALVENDVENHGDTVAVACVDKVLIVLRRAVSLVGSHVEVGVIAP